MSTDTGNGPRESKDAARRTRPGLEPMFRLIVWLVPTLDKFPRSQKFLRGDANLGPEKLRYLDLRRHE